MVDDEMVDDEMVDDEMVNERWLMVVEKSFLFQ